LDRALLGAAGFLVIGAGRLYVTPTPGSKERFLKRVQPILDAFDGKRSPSP
jgi:hypothetical protein